MLYNAESSFRLCGLSSMELSISVGGRVSFLLENVWKRWEMCGKPLLQRDMFVLERVTKKIKF